VATARSAGLLVLCDAKRGDIDSTCEAYADAWLSPRSALAGDAVTASAYLGFDALAPMFDAAEEHGRAVFVVARSSNPEGRPIQSARSASGSTVDDDLLASVARRNATWLAAVVAPIPSVPPAPSSARRSSRPSSTCAASAAPSSPPTRRARSRSCPDRRALRRLPARVRGAQRVALGPGQRAV